MSRIIKFIIGFKCFFTANLLIGQTQLPNIVFILADDLGYGSVNCYGADKDLVRTPFINSLAETGMKFTNANTPASVSSPTRYGLLTGSYPWRSALKYGVLSADSPLLPDPDGKTIADVLNDKGYNTAAIGKWHLGYGDKQPCNFTDKLTPGPLDLGFDYHFAVPSNHDDVWGVFIENDEIFGLNSKEAHPYSRSFYGSQYFGFDAPQRVNKDVISVLTEKSVSWLKKQSPDTPFFLYFAPIAVHHPITPSDYMRGSSNCGPYGDFIQDLDWSVGQILQTLEYMGLRENTIVVFTSDNGGDIPVQRPEAPEMQAINYGLKINGDLRGDKHTIWRGGTNVPFIVSWKGIVREGSISEKMINMVDVFATFVNITNDKMPDSKDIAPDSFSFLPYLLEKESDNPRVDMITADSKGMKAIQMEGWKYIDNSPPENFPQERLKIFKSEKEQLYNLSNDPDEKINLIAKYPEKAKQMREKMDSIQKKGYHR